MATNALTENWHVLVRKSIGLNREFNRIWFYLGMGVRYRNRPVPSCTESSPDSDGTAECPAGISGR